MPLPLALQERLAKRGLVKTGTETKKRPNEEVEEIIAESYDDNEPSKSNPKIHSNDTQDLDKILEKIPNCPNRSNPHHTCSEYCFKKFGQKKFEPHPIIEKRRIRMLKIYPLPPNWIEVPDINTNRYYYWNTESNMVSWYSPTHPKAKLEYSAKNKPGINNKSLNDKLDEFVDDLDNMVSSYQRNDLKNKSKTDTGNKKQKKALANDPMDPSSYSDCPKGKWSDGLEIGSKNSADDTASGPLFQTRPYPSPGQILKTNSKTSE